MTRPMIKYKPIHKNNKTDRKKDVSAYEIDAEKFWSNVAVGGEDECWLWRRGKNTGGYGMFSVKNLPEDYERTGKVMTQVMAHRVAYALVHPLRPSQYVLHFCDRKMCCNPAHLRAGTQQDNVDDMIAKQRGFWQGTRSKGKKK